MAILNENGVPLQLMSDISSALTYLHSRGYLYRLVYHRHTNILLPLPSSNRFLSRWLRQPTCCPPILTPSCDSSSQASLWSAQGSQRGQTFNSSCLTCGQSQVLRLRFLQKSPFEAAGFPPQENKLCGFCKPLGLTQSLNWSNIWYWSQSIRSQCFIFNAASNRSLFRPQLAYYTFN